MKRILLFLMVLLIPTVGAAETFGAMDVVTSITERTGGVPTQLLPHVQPLNGASEGGALRVQLIDAIFVDRAIVAAWTIENTGDEPLYLVDASQIDESQPTAIQYKGTGGILAPGEMRHCGYAGYLSSWQMPLEEKGTHMFSLQIAGLRLLGEPVYWDETVAPAMSEAERIARNDLVDDLLNNEGKVVIDQYDQLLPGHMPKELWIDPSTDMPTLAQALVQSGKAEAHSLVSVQAPVTMDVTARSILPEVSTVRADTAAGDISLEKAELSDARLVIHATFSFPDEASALAFYDYNDYDTPFPLLVANAGGNKDFSGMVNATFTEDGNMRMTEPKRLDDGTYIWPLQAEYWFVVSDSNAYQIVIE